MENPELLRPLQVEIRRHDLGTFVDEPPTIAQGGRGTVTPGCPACQKKFYTQPQFLDRLANAVLPKVISP
jgi:hypothetical protein